MNQPSQASQAILTALETIIDKADDKDAATLYDAMRSYESRYERTVVGLRGLRRMPAMAHLWDAMEGAAVIGAQAVQAAEDNQEFKPKGNFA